MINQPQQHGGTTYENHHIHHQHQANQAHQQPQIFSNVTIRPFKNPNHYLFVSSDNHRNFNTDFDVRTHPSKEERNMFQIENYGDGLCTIKHQQSGTVIFGAEDGSRKYKDDYDVRAHECKDQKGQVKILKTTTPNVYLIQLTKKPHFIFCCDDGTNAYNEDFDVRTHNHSEERNQWFIDGFNY